MALDGRRKRNAFAIRTAFLSVASHADPEGEDWTCRCEPEIGMGFCSGVCSVAVEVADDPEAAAELTGPVFVRVAAIAADGREFVRLGGIVREPSVRNLKRTAGALRDRVIAEAWKRPEDHPSQKWVNQALSPSTPKPRTYSPPHHRPLYPA